jgi:hypothetical protein
MCSGGVVQPGTGSVHLRDLLHKQVATMQPGPSTA